MISNWLLRSLDRYAWLFLAVLAVIAIMVPVCNAALPPSHPFHVSIYLVTLFGKYLCYALLALSVGLVWGYVGILSLGHGAFFALGGYAMGMYLMRQIGPRACLWPSRTARLHGVLELGRVALVLAWFRPVLVRRYHGRRWCPACSPSSSAGSPFEAASPASTCQSSPRRSPSP